MYLRSNRRKRGSERYEYWTLVENRRIVSGTRQRIVATLGKQPGMDRQERIGWEQIGRILDGKPEPEPQLFEEKDDTPEWTQVDVKSVRVGEMGTGEMGT